MASNVDIAEVKALLGQTPSLSALPPIETRDFNSLRRLDGAELNEIRRRLDKLQPDIETYLTELLKSKVSAELAACNEINAKDLFRLESGPCALLRFASGGHPGWCRWDLEAAVNAIEGLLGARRKEADPNPPLRALSTIERALLLRMLRGLGLKLASALGLELEKFEAVADLKLAGSYIDCGAPPDPYRLSLEYQLGFQNKSSSIRFTLPVTKRAFTPKTGAESIPAKLPVHLSHLPISVSAQLGFADLQVADLLELEVGDVVALDTRIGRPIKLDVEGKGIGHAHMGRRGGRVAVRVLDLSVEIGGDAR